jgi:predicted DNA-binding transcriptional regulator AlpA
VPAGAKYLSAKQYCQRLGGRSFMTLDRLMKRDADFPRPVYFGRLRYFKISDIEAYERLCEIRTAAKAVSQATARAARDT